MERDSNKSSPPVSEPRLRVNDFWGDVHRWVWLWCLLGAAASVGRNSTVWFAMVWLASLAALIAIAGSSATRSRSWRVLVGAGWCVTIAHFALRRPELQSVTAFGFALTFFAVCLSVAFAALMVKEAEDRAAFALARKWRWATALVAALGASGLIRFPWGNVKMGPGAGLLTNILGIFFLLVVGVTCLRFLIAASATSAMATAVRGICVRCGFDLHGIAGPLCPECGTPFDGQFPAHRPGTPERRKRSRLRPWLLASALTLPPAFAAYLVSPDNRLETHKPIWLLTRDASLLVPVESLDFGARFAAQWQRSGPNAEHPSAERAQAELLLRLKAGRISAEDSVQLASIALDIQRDPERPLGKWLEIFEAAYALGGVPKSELERAFVGCAQWRLVTRKRLAVGDPFPMRLELIWRGPASATRLLPGANDFIHGVDVVLTDLRLADQLLPVIPFRNSQGGSFGTWFDFGSFGRSEVPSAPTTPAATGNLPLTGRLQARWNRDLRAGFGPQQLLALGLPSQWDVPVNAQCEVLPGGTPTVLVREHPDLASEFLEHFRIDMSVEHRFLSIRQVDGSTVREWPADIALEVFADADGRWIHIGAAVWPKNGMGGGKYLVIGNQTAKQIDDPYRDTITLRLRPSVDAAKLAVDVDEVLVGPEFEVEVPKR